MDIADFLLARIAEDADPTTNHSPSCSRILDYRVDSPHRVACDCEARRRQDAECDAARRIVAEHGRMTDNPLMADADYARDQCRTCGYPERWQAAENGPTYPCTTLRLFALPYADHPDYRPEWRVVAARV